MKVKELKGWPHVFQLKSGASFRILPREEKEVDKSEVSADMKTAVSMGFISIIAESPKDPPAVKEYSREEATDQAPKAPKFKKPIKPNQEVQ